MKSSKNLLFSSPLLLLSNSVFSAPEYEGKVTGLYINSSATALVKLANGVDQPDCTPSWKFQFDSNSVAGEKWISMLLSARISSSDIRIGYWPDSSGQRCSVAYIYFN